MGSMVSSDSGVSLKSDQSKEDVTNKDRDSPSELDSSSSVKKHVVSDQDLVESPDDLRAMGSMVSSDSGVSLKSDQSKEDVTNKDRDSPRLADFSPSEEEHDVSDDKDLVKSPDDQGRETNQEVG